MRQVIIVAVLLGLALGAAGCGSEKGEPAKKTVKDSIFRNRFGEGEGVPAPTVKKK